MDKNFEFPVISINKIEYNAIQQWIISHEDIFHDGIGLYIFGAGIRGNVFLGGGGTK